MLSFFLSFTHFINCDLDRILVAALVESHIHACKQIPYLKYALPIIIPESNLPTMALELQRTLKHQLHTTCQFMTEDKRKDSVQSELPGSYTTHTKKIEMVHNIINRYLKPHKIVVNDDFIVTFSESIEATSGIQVKKEMERQMRNFSRIKQYRKHKDCSLYCEFFYNGKSSGENDDQVMAIIINALMYKWFMEKDKYKGIRSM